MNPQRQFPKSAKPHSSHPLCRGEFFRVLESSQVVGEDTGWSALYFSKNEAVLPAFLKSHSYGEYIFDWQWAQSYEHYGYSYYPKMIHALPFTPINAPKVWGGSAQDQEELLQECFNYYQSQKEISGEHYLFIDETLAGQLEKMNFFTMYSLQYHWMIDSEWADFNDFLSTLKSSKRKMIKKERNKVDSYDLQIEWRNASDLRSDQCQRVFELYLETIDKKNSYAYLNQRFFLDLFRGFPSETKVLMAYKNNEMIAMSLFIDSADILYGRYWGIDRRFSQDYPLLHFEMCYYRGMDYCLEKKRTKFEAGAQGEQKLWRGFHPVKILSAHHLRDAQFSKAIADFVSKQNKWQVEQIEKLKLYLPYQS